jgi:hypothetical protein
MLFVIAFILHHCTIPVMFSYHPKGMKFILKQNFSKQLESLV